jgi:hypothetical protein
MRAVESLRSDRSQVEPIRDSMKRSNRVAEFPRGGIATALMLGIPSFMIAGISTAFVVEYSVASDRILAFRGHVIGGAADIAVAAVLAVAFGAVGIVCFLRLWTETRVWREQSVGVR